MEHPPIKRVSDALLRLKPSAFFIYITAVRYTVLKKYTSSLNALTCHIKSATHFL